jgi:tetratricopeptide (TPR) repeat protein
VFRPFTFAFSRMIGRQEFDKAIDYLRSGLRGNESDLSSLEVIAHCHQWAGRADDAIKACREALQRDPKSFDMHSMLAQLLAEKGEHEGAAIHARRGLECYPEPLPEIPRFLILVFQALDRILPRRLRGPDANDALRRFEAEKAEWFNWAKKYLNWYDSTHNDRLGPTEN